MSDKRTSFFKLDRKIFDSDIWTKPHLLRLFVYLIGQARFLERPNKKYKSYGIIIKRGQYLKSYRALQRDLEYIENNQIKKYSLSKIKRYVDKLINEDRIETEKTELGTLFTIINYCQYQDSYKNNDSLEQGWNGDGTGLEQHRNNTKNVEEGKRKKKKEINIYADEIEKFYNCWKEHLSDINNPRLTKKQKERIANKLKKWNIDDMIQAVKNYNEVYRSDYYYSHNFTMFKFVKQKNGIPRFLPGLDNEFDGDIWKDYNKNSKYSSNNDGVEVV